MFSYPTEKAYKSENPGRTSGTLSSLIILISQPDYCMKANPPSTTREMARTPDRVPYYQPRYCPQQYGSYRVEAGRLSPAVKRPEQESPDHSSYKTPIRSYRAEELLKSNEKSYRYCSSPGSDNDPGNYKSSFISNQGENDEIIGLRSKVSELHKENDSLRNSLKDSAQQDRSTRGSWSSSSYNSQIEEKVKALEKELQSLKSQNEALVNENKYLQEKAGLSGNDLQSKDLELQLQTVTNEKAGLMREVQKLQQDLRRARSQSLSFTTPSANTSEIESFKKNINQKISEISELKQKLLEANKYKFECERLRTELTRVKENLEKKTAQVEDLSFKVKDLRNKEIENKELKKRYFLMRTACQMFQPKIQSLNSQLEQMGKLVQVDEVLDVEIEIRKLLDERDILVIQNQRLRAPLDKAFQAFEDLKQQIAKRIEEFDNIRQALNYKPEELMKIKEGNEAEDAEKLKTLQAKAAELAESQVKLREYDGVKADLDQMAKELKSVQDRFKRVPSQAVGV